MLAQIIGMPLLMSLFAGRTVIGHPIVFMVLIGINMILWCGVLAVLFSVRIAQATSSPLFSTAALTERGIVDITPTKTAMIPWTTVHGIRRRDDAIFIWSSGLTEIQIPPSAFQGAITSEQFYDAAVAAWRGDHSLLQPADTSAVSPAETQANPAIWPPPPTVTSESLARTTTSIVDTDWDAFIGQLNKKRPYVITKFSLLAAVVVITLIRGYVFDVFHPSAITMLLNQAGLLCTVGVVIAWVLERRA
jgi:hypothetical protein